MASLTAQAQTEFQALRAANAYNETAPATGTERDGSPLWRRRMLTLSLWYRGLALFVVLLALFLAVTAPLWCFATGMW